MLGDIRVVLTKMRAEPELASDIAIVKRSIFVTLAWLLLDELYLVLQVYPVKFFMDEITRSHPRLNHLVVISLLFLLLYGVGTEIFRKMDCNRNTVNLGSWRLWWGFGHRCVLRQSKDWHVKHGTGEKSSLVARNVMRIEGLFDEILFNTFPVLLRITFTTSLMFFIGWQLGMVAIATCLLYSLAMWFSEKGFTPLREKFQADMKEAEKVGDELNRNWRTIRNLGLEEKFADDNEKLLKRIWFDDIPRHKQYLKHMLRQERVLTLSRAGLYLVIGLSVASSRHGLSFGTIVLATAWMEKAYSNFGRFMDFQRRLNEGKTSLKELVTFMQLPPSVRAPVNPLWPEKILGRVEFEKVSFSYPESDRLAIDSLSLVIEPFTTTALVGPSGCGKSTAMSLLTREYDVRSGAVLIDDIDLRQLNFERLRREGVAIVPQGIELFDRSIADNIRITRPEATLDEVIAAATLAGAHDFISLLEHGYDTMIGENGVKLSGGQKQRIAIARALLTNPAVLIMDEATSALDALSQAHVQHSLNSLMRARKFTLIVIAHRLSTVMNADQVVVMENGAISGIGTHAELHKMNGLYKQLCDLELEKGILDDDEQE